MIPIKLTEEHKSKLLEMCNKLFPGYKFVFVSEYFGLNENSFLKGESNNIILFLKSTNSWYLTIHWFEFIFCHLITKLQIVISNKLGEEAVWKKQPEYVNNVFDWKKNNKWTLYSEFMFLYPKMTYKKHPVDYLYEEFKKLKL